MSNTLGHRIELLRQEKGWSKAELARRASVTTTAVWNWEVNGRRPRPETMSGIARALGVSESFLEHGYDPPASGTTGSQKRNDKEISNERKAELRKLAISIGNQLPLDDEAEVRFTLKSINEYIAFIQTGEFSTPGMSGQPS